MLSTSVINSKAHPASTIFKLIMEFRRGRNSVPDEEHTRKILSALIP